MNTFLRITALLSVLLAASCTFVKLSEDGQAVSVVSSAQADQCQLLGHVTSTSRESVAAIERGVAKVRTELETLARNEAAAMGANAVTPRSPIEAGRQKFDALRCP